uniref:Receptor kinase-like protein Xa21 n=1 Tax=Oryza punctata TaxID=4537 RepID=A0A0E0MCZ2_ORYPU
MVTTTAGHFLLVFLASISHSVICSTSGNETDRLSLLEFKNAISLDPKQAMISWNDSNHFCSWEGVSCSSKNPPRVTSIDLSNQDLAGNISPSLGNLTFLRHLSLVNNRFTKQIPASLGHLRRLRSLYLSNNTLQGIIPSFTNCSELRKLWLNHNELAGVFPEDNPLGLEVLDLSFNNLIGTIPSKLGNFTALKKFGCAFNGIDGTVPGELAALRGLEELSIPGNRLSGGFPEAILNMSALVVPSLTMNRFSGMLPSVIGSSLPSLEEITIGGNFFQGNLPSSLANASNLVRIDMTDNNFTGVVPTSIGKLANLIRLSFQTNQLHARSKQDWEFMDSLANCTQLQFFSISRNQMEGHVPSSLGNFSVQLQYLYLGQNQLSGSFPSGIANLPNLILLGLDYNRFTGSVPQWLGGLKKLQMLSLTNNNFTGYVPSSLSNLTQLTSLILESNQFIGNIPSSFGNLQFLTTLTISRNNLHGSVPKEIFSIPTIAQLGFAFNNLSGELPTEVGNAKHLWNLQLSSNNLSGDIPYTLGNCETLQEVLLDQNNFSGDIPTSFGKLIILRLLGLSQNQLSGSIPVSLGDLQLLEQLDLSFNHLTGQVPTKGIFKNSTAMNIDGNMGLCGGAPELHLPECPIRTSNKSKHKLSVVVKVVIPLVIIVALAIVILILFVWKGKKRTKSIPLPSFGTEFPKVSYSDLARATNRFSTANLIGKGRYSSVYQGQLFQDLNVVAIKVFSLETRGSQKSFIAECNTLRNVRHRNLVPILTACSSIDSSGNDFKALVYQFMPRGDLHKLLYSTRDDGDASNLNDTTLAQRINIVVDVSDALEYLHHNNQGTIIHCDLKPSNILLDDNMIAHVGDFGLARFRIHSSTSLGDSNSVSSFAIKGTIGYIAPECSEDGQVSTASDVFSFGVILLELFIRRRPTDDMFKDGLTIAKHVEVNFPDSILQIVDPQLQQELDLCQETPMAVKEKGVHCLRSVLNIGLCCTKTTPSERISIQEAEEERMLVEMEELLCFFTVEHHYHSFAYNRKGIHNTHSVGMKPIATGQSFVLLLVFSTASVVICSDGNGTDRLSLLQFKQAISLDAQHVLLSWNDSTHFCSWEGVSCSLRYPRRVTSLDLSNRGLVGLISPSLGNLTSLEHLFLNTNRLSGQIPSSIGHLHHLRSLYLANNTLQGNIPSFANCSALKILHLSRNQIIGHIPKNVHLPPSISQLIVNDNNLTGTIPTSLGNVATLNILIVSYNYIEGSIPDEIGKMPVLTNLYVGGNNLSGRFPPALTNISSLVELGLGFNYFHGGLPPNLGTSLPRLQVLEIASNLFEGYLPYSISNATSLYTIDFSSNYFSGVVPSSIGMLKELSLLNLEWNQFESFGNKDLEFLHSLSNCTELQVLALDDNKLKGQIPYSLGNLSIQLQYLFLGSNQLSGGFPSGIRNLPNLISLGLNENHFTGMVPEWVGTLTNLEGIYLDNNRFTGFLPSSISNISNLEDLRLSTNLFGGKIPAGLGKLQVLHLMELSDNNLHGSIPESIFNIPTLTRCMLSFNKLDGALPTEIGNAKQLGSLHLSSNKLTGHIPSTLSNCDSLEELHLDQNFLNGSIPASLGNMQSLTAVNLSYNDLSGSIPDSLGRLQSLEQLDLSFNNLVGEVPGIGVFKNATAIRLNGNHGLCNGAPKLDLPRCPTMSSSVSKHKPSQLLKFLVPFASVVSLAIVICIILFWRKKQKKEFISLPSFGTKFPKVSYRDLDRATDGFSASNLIGTGRYGSVYMGKLFHSKCPVAVKVFNLDIRGTQRSFISECNSLRNLRHRNIVRIITACSTVDSKGNDFKALIYEFMPRGDLYQVLYSTCADENSSTRHFGLAQRVSIVMDIANALEYLHNHNKGIIVHCDLKPSNILLDDNMTAHVGDFGLSRFEINSMTSSFGCSTSSVAISGTIGYVAPECAESGQVSTATDVYSFGVVLLEIFIRRRPTDDMFNDGLSISKFAELNFPDRVLQIVDPQLQQDLETCQETPMAIKKKLADCLLSVLSIGLSCTKSSPSERNSMKEVAIELHRIWDAYLR